MPLNALDFASVPFRAEGLAVVNARHIHLLSQAYMTSSIKYHSNDADAPEAPR